MPPKRPDETLLNIFISHINHFDINGIQLFLKEHPNFNINTQSYDTERTGLHTAAYLQLRDKANALKVYDFLKSQNASDQIEDREGYTPADLIINPHPFHNDSARSNRHFFLRNRINYYLCEENHKLSELKDAPASRIFFVENINELMMTIATYKQYKKLGFIVFSPLSIRGHQANGVAESHTSPILYDRDRNVFVQLDSCALLFFLPAIEGAKLYFYGEKRQTSKTGCAEDALALLFKILLSQFDIVGFAEKNASVISDKLFEKMPSAQITRFQNLTMKSELHRKTKIAPSLTPDEKNEFRNLVLPWLCSLQRKEFKIRNKIPLRNVYQFTEWPKELALFIERQGYSFEKRHNKWKENISLVFSQTCLLFQSILREKAPNLPDEKAIETSRMIAQFHCHT